MSLGLYVHVPFCRTRCDFCAFYLQIYRADRAEAYRSAFIRELELHRDHGCLDGRSLETVYFGGGTPTVVPAEDLCHMLASIAQHFTMAYSAEVTVEAHPDTVNAPALRTLRDAGFTRISFGVQSMQERELLNIGRPVLPESICRAVDHARAAGFEAINLDLMYGLPGQTRESWRSTLNDTLALSPDHVSCYALTIDEGSRMALDVARELTASPDEALQNEMEDEAVRRLADAGFHRYEISNFCRPGFECRHNLLYWTGEEYIGLGPSAQSYLQSRRFGNISDLAQYVRALKAGRFPIADSESLSTERRRRERIIFGLRLIDGLDLHPSEEARSPESEWERRLNALIVDGLVEQDAGRIRLTDRGRRFADSVAVRLL